MYGEVLFRCSCECEPISRSMVDTMSQSVFYTQFIYQTIVQHATEVFKMLQLFEQSCLINIATNVIHPASLTFKHQQQSNINIIKS